MKTIYICSFILATAVEETLQLGNETVVLVHGILDDPSSLRNLQDWIRNETGYQDVHIADILHGYQSLLPIWFQTVGLASYIRRTVTGYQHGIHIIGYSQGGLVARATIQAFPDIKVKTFVSLSSPQGGQYGDSFLKLYYPFFVKKTVYKVFYSKLGQSNSVANYWRDPYHLDLYLKYSDFLPYLNNELESPDSWIYKKSIMDIEKMVLIGGPDDGVITPWQSSQFGHFGDEENVTEMHQSDLFIHDRLGLRYLEENGRLVLHTVSGVKHTSWHTNFTVFTNCILPYL